jgi:hypothetical protein
VKSTRQSSAVNAGIWPAEYIVSARLRPLAWKGVRLTARQFLAGFGYTAGAAAAAELLGHVAVGSSPLMLLCQYLVQ